MRKVVMMACVSVSRLSVATGLVATNAYVKSGNRKACAQLSEKIRYETGRAFAVGYNSDTVVVSGTVDTVEEQDTVNKLAISSLKEFNNEHFFTGPGTRYLSLIGIAGQTQPVYPESLGVITKDAELNWEEYMHPSSWIREQLKITERHTNTQENLFPTND